MEPVTHHSSKEPCLPPDELSAITQRCIDVFLRSKQPNGHIGGIGWWQTANGYTAIALHDLWSSGSSKNYGILAAALRRCENRKSSFINEFNDDTLWWAICCLHVHNIGKDPWFLNQAVHIWNHIRDSNSICVKGQARFRGMDMEGACYWRTNLNEEQVNSISTGLFAELSVRLALVRRGGDLTQHSTTPSSRRKPTSRNDYIEAARCSLGWILRCRYRDGDALVLDNILLHQQIAQDWTFTYTTGVAIGVCALLLEATESVEYLSLACTMARKAMIRRSWVEGNGVLTEHSAYGKGNHKPWQNNDAVGFKAVLVRQLASLHDVIVRTRQLSDEAIETAALIKRFVNVNLKSQQERNTNGKGQYGPWWNGPFEMPTSHSQMAVLDVMAAAKLVNQSRMMTGR